MPCGMENGEEVERGSGGGGGRRAWFVERRARHAPRFSCCPLLICAPCAPLSALRRAQQGPEASHPLSLPKLNSRFFSYLLGRPRPAALSPRFFEDQRARRARGGGTAPLGLRHWREKKGERAVGAAKRESGRTSSALSGPKRGVLACQLSPCSHSFFPAHDPTPHARPSFQPSHPPCPPWPRPPRACSPPPRSPPSRRPRWATSAG